MLNSLPQFIFQNSPEMGREKIVQNESTEELKELPSGAEMVDSLANLEPFPVNEAKEALGLESDTEEVDGIGELILAIV